MSSSSRHLRFEIQLQVAAREFDGRDFHRQGLAARTRLMAISLPSDSCTASNKSCTLGVGLSPTATITS